MMFDSLLDQYVNEIDNLVSLLREIHEDEIDYLPHRDDGWTIRKHLIHILNVEMQSAIRIMVAGTAAKQAGLIVDSKSWIKEDITNSVKTNTIINALESIKQLNYEILKYNECLQNEYVECIYNDELIKLTLEDNTNASLKHLRYHKEFIDDNLLEYKEIFS